MQKKQFEPTTIEKQDYVKITKFNIYIPFSIRANFTLLDKDKCPYKVTGIFDYWAHQHMWAEKNDKVIYYLDLDWYSGDVMEVAGEDVVFTKLFAPSRMQEESTETKTINGILYTGIKTDAYDPITYIPLDIEAPFTMLTEEQERKKDVIGIFHDFFKQTIMDATTRQPLYSFDWLAADDADKVKKLF